MILLNEGSYSKLDRYLDDIHFNHLFARAVIEKSVSGRVYVDDLENPACFYIVHRYGMSLLGGSPGNADFNSAFKAYALNTQNVRNGHEWMQIFPLGWESVLKDLFKNTLISVKENHRNIVKGVVERNTRINFTFNKQKFLSRRELTTDTGKIKIVKNTETAFTEMHGSVVPSFFWNSASDFISNGVAFGLYIENQLAALAFSSFVAPGKLELGIETKPEFRGRGLAEKVCTALIGHCLENNLEPIWACRLENTGSFLLAQKLGFEVLSELPYYRLSD